MTMFDSYLCWEEDYIQRENEFLDFVKYVPLDDEHDDVWSIKLANQLLLIGSSIDSFFKSAMHFYINSSLTKYYEQCSGIYGYNLDYVTKMNDLHKRLVYSEKKNKRGIYPVNMNDYRIIFGEYYNLSNQSVYMLRTKEEIKPFEKWKDLSSPNLEWWDAYTKLKHSRFRNKKAATYKIVLNALAALFLINTCHFENRGFLVDRNVIRSSLSLRRAGFADGYISTLEPIIAKTKLFGYVFETLGSWHQRPWDILDPGNVYGL